METEQIPTNTKTVGLNNQSTEDGNYENKQNVIKYTELQLHSIRLKRTEPYKKT